MGRSRRMRGCWGCVVVAALVAMSVAACSTAPQAAPFTDSQLVQLDDLPDGWVPYEVPAAAKEASGYSICGIPYPPGRVPPTHELSGAWSAPDPDGAIVGERLERYPSWAAVRGRAGRATLDELPCAFPDGFGGDIVTEREPPVLIDEPAPDAQVITVTSGDAGQDVPGPKGEKHQFQVVLFSGKDVVALSLDVAADDRQLLERIVVAAWERYLGER